MLSGRTPLRRKAVESERVQRRLAAILAADVAGYSRLIGVDEEGTLARLRALRCEVIDPAITSHSGRIVKTTGDGILIEFASVVDAVRCAVEVQRAMVSCNSDLAADRRIEFRVGINLGDVVVERDDLLGDGVNVAARLESIAEPGGICVSEDAYRHARDKVDASFFDIGEQRLKNIARPVRVYRMDIGDDRSRPQVRPTLALPDKPSIAVLPFQNMSGDPEQEYFADGMVEEITTALSRICWLFVIARNSSFTYKGQAFDVKQVGRELGVRYVLEGSVRKAGNRIRITGQLIDATTGAHLWADRFDGPLEDVFDLQDSVAASVAGVIEPTLRAAETQQSVQRRTDDLTAYDLYLRARVGASSWDKEGAQRALDALGKALELDPHYAPALALVADCHRGLHMNGSSENPERDRQEGVEYARRALRVGGDDPDVLGYVAYALGYFERDINPAIALIDRALELNPNFASGWLWSGYLRLWSGQPDLAIEHFERSLRLNPRRKAASFSIGVAHFFARRLDKAAALLLLAMQETPNWAPTYRFLASCYAHMGRLRDAQDMVQRLRGITPLLIPSAEHWRIPEDREFYLAGLRQAVGG
jgi:TolB-like protein/class 3 adenylate cyclase